MQSFGFEHYRETRWRLGLARRITLDTLRHISLGVYVERQGVSIPSYGSASAWGLSAGWLAHLSTTLQIGFHATNPSSTRRPFTHSFILPVTIIVVRVNEINEIGQV